MPTSRSKPFTNRNKPCQSGVPAEEQAKAAAAQTPRNSLNGAFTVLAHEDRRQFEALLDAYLVEFAPATTVEVFLVEQLVQARWTMLRADRLENIVFRLLSGATLDPAHPDVRLAAALFLRKPDPLYAVQRYRDAASRSYFMANTHIRRELRKRIAAKAKRKSEPCDKPVYYQ